MEMETRKIERKNRIKSWLILFFVLIFGLWLLGRQELFASPPAENPPEEFSSEDLEIIKNLELLENLDFLNTEMALLDNYEVLNTLDEKDITEINQTGEKHEQN